MLNVGPSGTEFFLSEVIIDIEQICRENAFSKSRLTGFTYSRKNLLLSSNLD